MKTISCLLLAFFVHSLAFSQDQLVKDLDNDTIKDTVYLDREASRLVCKLSTQNFTKIQSKAIDILNETSGVRATKSGFELYNDWMRAGYGNQFRYDVKTKKMQLIGMSRYEFGNAVNDGSGESSINLLTNDYIGNWNYFDATKEELVKIPTVKTKLALGKIYLDTFNDETYFTYAEKCAALYEKHKQLKAKNKANGNQ
jgi:hypothetical protein